jgi:hypothetical protein
MAHLEELPQQEMPVAAVSMGIAEQQHLQLDLLELLELHQPQAQLAHQHLEEEHLVVESQLAMLLLLEV